MLVPEFYELFVGNQAQVFYACLSLDYAGGRCGLQLHQPNLPVQGGLAFFVAIEWNDYLAPVGLPRFGSKALIHVKDTILDILGDALSIDYEPKLVWRNHVRPHVFVKRQELGGHVQPKQNRFARVNDLAEASVEVSVEGGGNLH